VRSSMIVSCTRPFSFATITVPKSGDGNKYAILFDTIFWQRSENSRQRMEMRLMTRVKKTTVCPLGGDGVGGKWKFWILYHLLS
jgi:hypothetical protein